MKPVIALICLFALTQSSSAQTVRRVRVSLTANDSSGVVAPAIATALRSLSDVKVVGPNDEADYGLAVVVICSPSCSGAVHYSVALRLFEPLTEPLLRGMLETSGSDSLRSLPFRTQKLLRYERNYGLWVAQWGSGRYEQAAREYVRRIDSMCFDYLRTLNRATDSAAVRAWLLNSVSGKWICGGP